MISPARLRLIFSLTAAVTVCGGAVALFVSRAPANPSRRPVAPPSQAAAVERGLRRLPAAALTELEDYLTDPVFQHLLAISSAPGPAEETLQRWQARKAAELRRDCAPLLETLAPEKRPGAARLIVAAHADVLSAVAASAAAGGSLHERKLAAQQHRLSVVAQLHREMDAHEAMQIYEAATELPFRRDMARIAAFLQAHAAPLTARQEAHLQLCRRTAPRMPDVQFVLLRPARLARFGEEAEASSAIFLQQAGAELDPRQRELLAEHERARLGRLRDILGQFAAAAAADEPRHPARLAAAGK